jgi:uncharacterized protein (DUF1501 family)
MNRRKFLAASSALTVPMLLNGFELKAMTRRSALVQSLMETNALATDRVLVIVYLNGGNDGLNTVIPTDQLSRYTALRGNIAIPQANMLALNGRPEMAFHPAMTGMRNLFNDGRLSVIHSVAYPNPDQSHFRSTDIYMTAADSNVQLTTGWMGRYLDDRYPNYPTGYPNAQMEDPLALQIGYMTSTTLLGPTTSMGVAVNDPEAFYQLVGAGQTTPPADVPPGDAGDMVAYIRQQQALAVGYAGEIKAAFDAGQNFSTYPQANQNYLADQLKIVSRLIHGGLKTKIYFVSLGGFDTHSTQIHNGNPLQGDHFNLLSRVSEALWLFQEDLRLQGVQDKVLGMTFSDFGRRANSNASFGTDHGVAAPQFVFGTSMKRQVIGQNPSLAVNDLIYGGWGNNYDIRMQIDFRRLYRDVLIDWFGVPQTKSNSLLLNSFATTSLFSDTCESVATGDWQTAATWTTGSVPTSADRILVNPGHVVTLNQTVTVKQARILGTVKYVGNGKLRITG